MAWEQLKKFGQIECTILPDNIWSEKSSDRNTHTGGTNLVNYPNNTIIYQSDDIVIHKGPVDDFSGSNNSLYVRTRRSSTGWDAPVYVGSADNSYYGYSEVYVSAAIDKDNQIGALALTCHNNYSGQWNCGAVSFDSINNFTNAIYLDLLNEYPKYAGGAGSGYIGNPLLSRKKMVGYNVPTSSSASTKTLSTDMYNSVATYDAPKEGNGYARIRYLRKTNIPEEYAYISNINELWTRYNDNYDDHVNFYEYSSTFREQDYTSETYTNANPKLYTHYGIYIVKTVNGVEQNCHDKNFITSPDEKPLHIASLNGIMTINVDTTNPSNVVVTYSKDTHDQLDFVGYRPNDYLRIYAKRDDDIFHFAYTYEGGLGLWSTFSSLSDAIWYIYRQYSNINLIVDGVAWVNAL